MRRRDVSEKGLCQCTLQIWWSLISKMWEIRWVVSMDLWRSAALTAGAGKEISDVQVLYGESKLGKADKGAFLFPPPSLLCAFCYWNPNVFATMLD